MGKKWRNSAWWILGGTALVLTTFSLGGCTGKGVAGSISGMVKSFMPPTPRQAASEAFNMYDPDKRREGVALLSASSFGGKKPYVAMYRLLLSDPDPTVRAVCAKALGEHGDVNDAKRLMPLLEDNNAFVRWETAKALQRIHNKVVVPQLIDRLSNDEDADVRMACARALGQYPQPRVFSALVGALADPNYGVVASAAWSLKTLTGASGPGDDGAAWLRWQKKHAENLFAHQQTYTYQPYDAPPSFLRKMEFWKPIKQPTPKAPVGETVTPSKPVG